LRLAFVVLVRGVDEVAASRGVRVDDPVAVLLVGAEAPDVTEAHRTEAQLRHPEPTWAQQLVSHRLRLPARRLRGTAKGGSRPKPAHGGAHPFSGGCSHGPRTRRPRHDCGGPAWTARCSRDVRPSCAR